jgi:hypothetical protein
MKPEYTNNTSRIPSPYEGIDTSDRGEAKTEQGKRVA